MRFSTTLDSLLDSSAPCTSLGGSFAKHLMLYALVQQMWFFRQTSSTQCYDSHMDTLSTALDKWEAAAYLASESSISPHNPRAPLVYSSHALLRLARLYICVDMYRVHTAIASHNRHTISRSIATQLTVTRSAINTQAALDATKALRVPLRFGIALNNGCASLQYFIFSFDCGRIILFPSPAIQLLVS